MANRTYGQYCGFARALEVVGERWTLLIVRDLLVGPKRFTDLHQGLAGIPTNVLTARLKELEEGGVVRRRALPAPERSIIYELTEYGAELEDVVAALGNWGAKKLGDPRPGEVVTAESLVTALRTIFHPENARGVRATFELHMGEVVLHARVANKKVEVGKGPVGSPDLIIGAGPAIKAMFTGEITPSEALKRGHVHIKGERALLDRFAEMFRIEPERQSVSA